MDKPENKICLFSNRCRREEIKILFIEIFSFCEKGKMWVLLFMETVFNECNEIDKQQFSDCFNISFIARL